APGCRGPRLSARPAWLARAVRAPMDAATMSRVITRLRAVQPSWNTTALAAVADTTARDPFRILVSCLLSLRTRDETTGPAAARGPCRPPGRSLAGAEDREPGRHLRLRASRYLRRHARASHHEPLGLRTHQDPGAHRVGAAREAPAPALDRAQRPAGRLRAERLPAALAPLLDLPGGAALPPGGRRAESLSYGR